MWNPSSVEEAPGDRASGRQTKKWTTEETNKERWEEPQGNVTKRKKASRVLAVQLAQTSRTLVHSSMILIYDTVRKPLLRKGNKTKRLKYAWEHNNWNSDQWKKVLWSDKSKFEIFGSMQATPVRMKKKWGRVTRTLFTANSKTWWRIDTSFGLYFSWWSWWFSWNWLNNECRKIDKF